MPYLAGHENSDADCYETDDESAFEYPHNWTPIDPIDGWDTQCTECRMLARSVPVRDIASLWSEREKE